MRIAIVCSHAWPVPSPVRGGDVCIHDLAIALDQLGHEVIMLAPRGTDWPNLCETMCSYGTTNPSAEIAEEYAWEAYRDVLLEVDVVHDHSVQKGVAEKMLAMGRTNVISTCHGGTWDHPEPPLNVTVPSHAMRERALRGVSDYDGCPVNLGPDPIRPLKDAHVVHLGVDTDWYTPGGEKQDFFLWLNRWHPVKGFQYAIDAAKKTGLPVVIAGEHPDNELSRTQAAHAREAEANARDCPNITIEWLPIDNESHQERKRELYRQARALLYPVQFHEPFGLSMCEAMACGTPVIANRYGSVREVVGAGGTLVDPKDPDGFAKALGETLPVSVIQRLLAERFSRIAMAQRYLAEYERVIDGEVWGR